MNSQLHTLFVTENIGRRIQDAGAVRLARELRRSQPAAGEPVSTRPRRFRRLVARTHSM
jgi:hypothetical protein